MTTTDKELRLEVLEAYAETGDTSLLEVLETYSFNDRDVLGVEFNVEVEEDTCNPYYR